MPQLVITEVQIVGGGALVEAVFPEGVFKKAFLLPGHFGPEVKGPFR